MNKQTLITKNADNFLTADLDGEVVMMNIDSGDYIGLNEVGTTIWQLLDSPLTFEQLIAHLVNQYRVDSDACSAQTTPFLIKMKDIGAIVFN